MTNAEEMVLKTVHDLGVAGDSDVHNYMGLSATKATRVLKSLERKGYLKIAAKRYLCGGDAYNGGIAKNTFIGNLWELTPKGKEAAQGIPDIDEPMCIPITNIQLEKMEELNGERKDGAD